MRDLNAMRVFVRVAELRSFTAAAKHLGLTASAVSKAVLRLEREFGVPLLVRTTRAVGLTAEGRLFFERARQMLSELEEAEHELTEAALVPRGHLRVQMPMGFGRLVVLPLLAREMPRFPSLKIDVELGERKLDVAEEGLDAVIRFGELPDSSLIARRLCEVRFLPCAAPTYLAARGVPRHPDDLHQHTCLGYAMPWRGHYRDWPFAKEGQAQTQAISGQLNINSAESLLNIAIEGAGITMVGDFVAHEAIRAGRLQIVLSEYLAPPVPVWVLYPPVRQRAPRLRWFLDLLQRAVPDPAPWSDITSPSTMQRVG